VHQSVNKDFDKWISVNHLKHNQALFINSSVLSLFNPSRDDRSFASPKTSIPALWPIQVPIRRVPGDLSPGVERPEREANYPHPISAEGNNEWTFSSTSLHGV
jgi:hypothetical protein